MVHTPTPDLLLNVEGSPETRGVGPAPGRRRGWFIRVRRRGPSGPTDQVPAYEPGHAPGGVHDAGPQNKHSVPGKHGDAAYHDVAGGPCCCAEAPAEGTAPRPKKAQHPPPTLVKPRIRIVSRNPRIAGVGNGGGGGPPRRRSGSGPSEDGGVGVPAAEELVAKVGAEVGATVEAAGPTPG